eukprot:6209402-Pleurochrysis_carterae.AAC.7
MRIFLSHLRMHAERHERACNTDVRTENARLAQQVRAHMACTQRFFREHIVAHLAFQVRRGPDGGRARQSGAQLASGRQPGHPALQPAWSRRAKPTTSPPTLGTTLGFCSRDLSKAMFRMATSL